MQRLLVKKIKIIIVINLCSKNVEKFKNIFTFTKKYSKMKNLSLLALLLLFSISTYGQSAGDITLAPQIGLNISDLDYDNLEGDQDFKSITNFRGGIIGEYYFSETWSFRSGLVYDALGAENTNGTLSLNYLNVPLNVNWHFGNDKEWYLNFGPAAGFLLDATSELNDGSEMDVKDNVKGLDFGLSVGIGYKYEVSESIMLFADVQGFRGFIDLNDGEGDLKLYNIRTAFNLGAIFKL